MSDSRPIDTAIHRMVSRCQANQYSPLVAKLPSGWVVMGERQVFAGYCLLLPDPVVPDLNCLTLGLRNRFLADMARVGDALLACTRAIRINYALFGNAEPALHAHIFPRFAGEPETTRTAHPWALDWDAAAQYSQSLHGEIKRAIAEHLA